MKQSHSIVLSLTLAIAFVALGACAGKSTPPPSTAATSVPSQSAATAPTSLPGTAVAGGIILTSTVTAVDLKHRLVTLQGEDGKTATFHVGEEVRNLPQVKVGDKVVIEYFEGLALKIVPTQAGFRKRTERVYVSRAKPGQRPAGQVNRVFDIVAKVQAIDPDKRIVTVRGVEKTIILQASKGVDLSKIKVGDDVLVTYEESFAISVQPAAGG